MTTERLSNGQVEIEVRNFTGQILAVEHEWQIPEGVQMVAVGDLAGEPVRLVVTITSLDSGESSGNPEN